MPKIFLFFLVLFTISSCKQEEGCFDEKQNQGESRTDCGGPCAVCPVEYFQFGESGINILAGTDTLFISESDVSLAVTIPGGSSLNVELRLISGTAWNTENNSNWTVNEYSFDRQLFLGPEVGNADLTILKGSDLQTDTILLRYFENGSEETLRKVMVWN